MSKHLLVDLENVQPTANAVAKWMGSDGKAWIFHGLNQHRLLPAFIALGERVTLIPISRPGANSLDFHLVFYLGYLAAGHPTSAFTLLSGDTGYDPAIAHAKLLKFAVKRIKVLGSVASRVGSAAKKSSPTAKKTVVKKAAAAKPATLPAGPIATKKSARPVIALYRDVLTDLRGSNRPRSMAALERLIQSRIGPEAAPAKIQNVMDHLKTIDAIQLVDGRIVYFPEGGDERNSATPFESPSI